MLHMTYGSVITALTEAFDLLNVLLKNHHRRVAVMSYHIAREMGLSGQLLKNTVVAASLHDLGALKAKERDELIHLDIVDPKPHAAMGYKMLKDLPYFDLAAKIVLHHHDRYRETIAAGQTPVESYIIHLADRIDILIREDTPVSAQVAYIERQVAALGERYFMPEAMDAFFRCSKRDYFWLDLDHMPLSQLMGEVLEEEHELPLNADLLEQLAFSLARIIDFRSPFTKAHSLSVGEVAYELALAYGFDREKSQSIKVAGYLHDIGKIGVPTEILDKPAKLDDEEFSVMKSHSYYTHQILGQIKGLEDIIAWASSHHERHNGEGYPYGLNHDKLTIESDIITFSDVFCALLEDRPYRHPMAREEVLSILKKNIVAGCNEVLYDAIERNYDHFYTVRRKAEQTASAFYHLVA